MNFSGNIIMTKLKEYCVICKLLSVFLSEILDFMNSEGWINVLSELGKNISGYLENGFPAYLKDAVENSRQHNPWFTEENIIYSLQAISSSLAKEKLDDWLKPCQRSMGSNRPRNVAVIMAGNIPMVGFNDFLCVLVSGNRFVGKLSSQDKFLLPVLSNELFKIDPAIKNSVMFTEDRLSGFDAVIATGSNNSSRYFEYYFGKYPHIIRKNRNSIAILTGAESREELELLSDDIFLYFGLGCRNVTKIFLPEHYDLVPFMKILSGYEEKLSRHNKYMNNYDYNKAVFLLNKLPHLDTGFCLLKEDASISSPISVLNYEYYKDMDKVLQDISGKRESIQCLVAKERYFDYSVPFGKSQQPELWDYADGVDTLEFLKTL
jgi:hypothetical protein